MSSQQNCYIDREGKDTRKKGKKDRRKIGNNGKISWDKKT